MRSIHPGGAEIGMAISEAIERFANKVASQLEQSGSGSTTHDAQLREIAACIREAGKTRRTRMAEERASTTRDRSGRGE